jgi:hypothetical protein
MRSGVFRGFCSKQKTLRRLETRMAARTTAWAGIDIGKTFHWMCAVDAEGRPLLSLKVATSKPTCRPRWRRSPSWPRR